MSQGVGLDTDALLGILPPEGKEMLGRVVQQAVEANCSRDEPWQVREIGLMVVAVQTGESGKALPESMPGRWIPIASTSKVPLEELAECLSKPAKRW